MDLKKHLKNLESLLLAETQIREKRLCLTYVFLEVQKILSQEEAAKKGDLIFVTGTIWYTSYWLKILKKTLKKRRICFKKSINYFQSQNQS